MKARHALYLGLVIAGASFLLYGSSTLGLILEGLGLIPLLISAIIEIATEKSCAYPPSIDERGFAPPIPEPLLR